MRMLRRLAARIKYRRFAKDLEEELAFHREMTGRTSGDRYEARRIMGNELLAREDARAVWIAPLVDGVWRAFRYACRSLAHCRGVTLTAAGVLAVAIGLNASLFALFNGLLMRPWPVSDAGNVVTLHTVKADDFRGMSVAA